MTSQVRHSERGAAISDCVVWICLIVQEIERLTDENDRLRERLKHIESTVSA